MRYRVIRAFFDLENNAKAYLVGDDFPHERASAQRLEQLCSADNRLGAPVLEEIQEPPEQKKPESKKNKKSKSMKEGQSDA